MSKVAFQAFKALELSKAPCFVKRGQWVDFHQAGSLQNEESLVLLTKAAKNGRWVSYIFLQKPSSFKFLSILEENCGADINNGTIKCKFLLTNVSKNGRWVSYTFLQKLSSFKFYSILEENCVADINNEAFECNIFVDNCCKNRFWVSYTFLQKPSLFKHFWI